MLVMSLLVVVAALAMPAVGVTLDRHYLRNAGEAIRTHWAKARVKAMENGRTYTFRYEPSGKTFIVQPWLSEDDYLESSEMMMSGGTGGGVGGGMAGGAAMGQGTTLMETPIEEALPDSVSFVGSEVVEDSRGMLISQVSGMAADTALSAPIFFYPDGTTSTARLVMVNERNRYITVSLRGLTGMTRVTAIQTFDEIQ
jgi:hypothetical protein